jgi:UV DNA damage endonuclease
MELGLCCKFIKKPIKFRIYTLSNIQRIHQNSPDSAREKVLGVVNQNIRSLQDALDYCRDHSIRSFRVSSDLIPHLNSMHKLNILNDRNLEKIQKQLSQIKTHDIVLSMHPGQHVNMGSPHPNVVENSLTDLKEHFFVAEPLGCKEINIHVGGVYGNKPETVKRFIKNMRTQIPEDKLSDITIENDELNYSVEEVVAIARELGIRATYDIHHQRCYEMRYPGTKSEREYLELCRVTWEGYGYQRVHLSSPKFGYEDIAKNRPHHDFINIDDLPVWLLEYPDVHLDIEAKAKELAIADLQQKLKRVKNEKELCV